MADGIDPNQQRALVAGAELLLRAADHLDTDPPNRLEAVRCLRAAVSAATKVHQETIAAVLASPEALDQTTRQFIDGMREGSGDGR